MTCEISWTYKEGFKDRPGQWILTVKMNGRPICWVFRKTEAECREWAEKNIQVYARGKLPSYG